MMDRHKASSVTTEASCSLGLCIPICSTDTSKPQDDWWLSTVVRIPTASRARTIFQDDGSCKVRLDILEPHGAKASTAVSLSLDIPRLASRKMQVCEGKTLSLFLEIPLGMCDMENSTQASDDDCSPRKKAKIPIDTPLPVSIVKVRKVRNMFVIMFVCDCVCVTG